MHNVAKQTQLTDKQKLLAEQNHRLIYSFAHKNNLDIDNYYGVLAIGLCKAAKAYNKCEYKFSTFAYRCMQNELNLCWKSTQRKSVIPEELIFSYDAPINPVDSDDNSLTKFITDDYLHNEMLGDMISSEFIDNLTDKEKEIISLLLKGMTHKEIADVMGFRRQNVNYHLKKIRKKADCLLV